MKIIIEATPGFLGGEFIGPASLTARDADGQEVHCALVTAEEPLPYVVNSYLHGDGEPVTGACDGAEQAWLAVGRLLGVIPPRN